MDNAGHGIVVEDSSGVSMDQCKISRCQGAGVVVRRKEALCALVSCAVFDCVEEGILVEYVAEVRVERSAIQSNGKAGILVDGKSAVAVAVSSDMLSNGAMGLGVLGGGCAELVQCNLSGNQQGLFVTGRNSSCTCKDGLLAGQVLQVRDARVCLCMRMYVHAYVCIRDN